MRFAITGLGVLSPLGAGEEALFTALASGRSGIAEDARGRERGFPFAARIGDFEPKRHIAPAQLRRMPRLSQLTVVAARQALAQAELPYDSARTGAVLGTGLGTLDETMTFVRGYVADGPEAASPATFPVSVMNAAAGQLAIECGLRGVNSTVNHRDHSPLSALAMACDLLELGRADALVCGGVDELSEPVHHAYLQMGGVSRTRLRPYDRERDGLIPGEAAALLVLEREEDAKKRGARIRAIVAGRGESGESRPRVGWGHAESWPEAARAVRDAAGDPATIGWVAGSGNGSSLDERELAALQSGLGRRPKVSSILGQIGESFSSGALRLCAAIYALEHQSLPGTVGLAHAPAGWDEALVRAPREAPIDAVLVPSFAQGGANLVVRLERAS